MTSNEIIARAADQARLVAREMRAGAAQLQALATRANIAATALELMAGDIEPPPDTPDADRSSHRS